MGENQPSIKRLDLALNMAPVTDYEREYESGSNGFFLLQNDGLENEQFQVY